MKKIATTFLMFILLNVCYAQNASGVYQTDFGEMTLQQTANKVIGTYKHQNGVVEGTISGNVLSGVWTQSNGKGKFVFVFNGNFTSFTGKWGYNDAEPTSAWNGKKNTTNNNTLNGTFTTDFNDLTFQQNANKVTGKYLYKDGRIEGTLNGKVLTGTWTQSNGKGKLVFVFNEDFTSFTGKWGYNEAEPTSAWNGKKK